MHRLVVSFFVFWVVTAYAADRVAEEVGVNGAPQWDSDEVMAMLEALL